MKTVTELQDIAAKLIDSLDGGFAREYIELDQVRTLCNGVLQLNATPPAPANVSDGEPQKEESLMDEPLIYVDAGDLREVCNGNDSHIFARSHQDEQRRLIPLYGQQRSTGESEGLQVFASGAGLSQAVLSQVAHPSQQHPAPELPSLDTTQLLPVVAYGLVDPKTGVLETDLVGTKEHCALWASQRDQDFFKWESIALVRLSDAQAALQSQAKQLETRYRIDMVNAGQQDARIKELEAEAQCSYMNGYENAKNEYRPKVIEAEERAEAAEKELAELKAKLQAAQGGEQDAAPSSWPRANSPDELESFYRSILPKIKEAARHLGYAIGVHGSMRRDLDLIAMPWVERHAKKDALAIAIQKAACGITQESVTWETKACGRVATSLPICWSDYKVVNSGHIDLSVIAEHAPTSPDKGGWRPISGAPKDGTFVDLYVAGEFEGRWADCYWGKPSHTCGEMGMYCDNDVHSMDDCWIDATLNAPVWDQELVTHWQPIPPAPTSPDKGE